MYVYTHIDIHMYVHITFDVSQHFHFHFYLKIFLAPIIRDSFAHLFQIKNPQIKLVDLFIVNSVSGVYLSLTFVFKVKVYDYHFSCNLICRSS